jgi:serine protease Do
MNTRTRTIASVFSVAMAAMLLGAIVTSRTSSPPAALASPASPAAPAEPAAPAVLDQARLGSPLALDTFREIARVATPGIVNINTSKVVRRNMRDPFRDFFGEDLMDRFFGPQGQGRGPQSQTQRSLGSGFVVDKEGYILTNRHVIEGADTISVTFGVRGASYDAKLVGKDARTDVALLKIESKEPLTALQLGDSDHTEVGEWVMAIGNPFGLGGNSVTVGVVSYMGRNVPLQEGTGVDMIQTDASINPGNSGGPLLNTRGQVVGINTLIITQGVPQSAGVGFAVPINVAKEILPQLREKGRVIRGWLGVNIMALSQDGARTYGLNEARGAVVSDVTPGSPAEKAGIKPEDVILGVDGKDMADNSEISRYVASRPPNSTVQLKVFRNGSELTIPVTLGTFPEQQLEAEAAHEGRAQLGMTLRDLTPGLAEQLELPRGTRGVVVADVEAGGAAENAVPSLQRGDVIVSVNGAAVAGVDEFEKEIERAGANGLVRLRVRRGENHLISVLRIP